MARVIFGTAMKNRFTPTGRTGITAKSRRRSTAVACHFPTSLSGNGESGKRKAMRRILVLVILAASASAAEWTSLFNGKDLTGWTVKCKPQDKGKEFWKVADGAIVCDSMGRKDHDYVWLMTEKEFGDFELAVKFRVFKDSRGNSGIQVRSRYDDAAGWLDGPQVDIHPPAPWRIGLIYDETRGERRWINPSLKSSAIDASHAPKQWKFKEDDWNDLTIICRGLHIKTILNGVVMSDYNGAGVLDNEAHKARNVGLRGHIALQLHNRDELRIRFKEISVKQ